MTTIMTITSKGQVTLPKNLLNLLGIGVGDRLLATVEPKTKKVVVEPLGKGVLDLVGKMPKLTLPKGKTIDQLIVEAKDEHFRKTLR